MSGEGKGEGVHREGEGPGEGIHPPEYKSPLAWREIAQKAEGNPKEKQAEAGRIAREEALYQGGMPVAGHNEPEPENDPGRERSR